MMEASEKRILCIGFCCLDIVMVCKSYPLEDSDQRCLSQKWQRGGNASNSCTVLAEFNFPCEMLGTMSYDVAGQFVKDDFTKHNICIENCRFYKEYEFPFTVVWVNSQNGSRTILCSEKRREITFEDFKQLKLSDYCWIHFEGRRNILDIKRMVQHIREWNEGKGNCAIKVSIEIEKTGIEFMDLLSLGEVVFISKDFASARGFTNMTEAVNGLCSKLRQDATIICAWGEKGACAKTPDGPVQIAKAYPPERMVSTLAAGDTFIAATIMSLIKEHGILKAIDIGCQVAGAKCGMHSAEGLSKLFPSLLWRKNIV